MGEILDNAWLYLTGNFSEFQLATVGSFILHEVVFFGSGIPFLLLEYFSVKKYRIQERFNSAANVRKCILKLLFYHFFINLPIMMSCYPMFKLMGLSSSLPLPSWKTILGQLLIFFVIEDFIFYWGHRLLHTKFLYKYIHSVHHEYATPFGLTAEYAHPLEIMFLGVATMAGPTLTGCHLLTLWIWMSVRLIETVEAHSGYEFPFSPSKLFPLYGGADFHDYHHRVLYTKSGNYASTFIYMDWLFGTDVGYRNGKEAKRQGVAEGKKAITELKAE